MSDNLLDRALLLGAVFGDGYIQKRGRDSYKVVVTSGNQYPAWFDRIDGLFDRVFGSKPRVYEKPRPEGSPVDPGYRFCEKYLTVSGSTLLAELGVLNKYEPGHGFGSEAPRFVGVPEWVSCDPDAVRSFVLGLVETDGCFNYATDSRCLRATKWVRFSFTQKDDGLSRWFQSALLNNGVVSRRDWGNASGTWRVVVSEQSDVKRLGEWLGSSAKYAALLASGQGPRTQPINRKTGEPLKLLQARFFPSLDMTWQLAWRDLRSAGVSLDKIAKAYRVARTTVYVVTRDVSPAIRMSPSEADHVLARHFDKNGKPEPRVWDPRRTRSSSGEARLSGA